MIFMISAEYVYNFFILANKEGRLFLYLGLLDSDRIGRILISLYLSTYSIKKFTIAMDIPFDAFTQNLALFI